MDKTLVYVLVALAIVAGVVLFINKDANKKLNEQAQTDQKEVMVKEDATIDETTMQGEDAMMDDGTADDGAMMEDGTADDNDAMMDDGTADDGAMMEDEGMME